MTNDLVVVRAANRAQWAVAAALQQLTNPSPWSPAQWSSACDTTTNTLWLGMVDELAVGFVLESTVLDELEVLDMGVSPGHRRRGLAGQLLHQVFSTAQVQGVRTVHLEVRASNEAARRLYAAAGMSEAGHRRRYYRNPEEDAVLMHLDLVGKS
jgi:ribosomal-protein-alanine N-acetyltransferase